jgi:hypothetical protein
MSRWDLVALVVVLWSRSAQTCHRACCILLFLSLCCRLSYTIIARVGRPVKPRQEIYFTSLVWATGFFASRKKYALDLIIHLQGVIYDAAIDVKMYDDVIGVRV